MMRRILAVLAVWSICVIISLAWGFRLEWPDFVHDDYGIPLRWATHTLSTFAGPADAWSIDITALIIDLIFWQIILAAVVVAVFKLRRQPEKQG
ncbi:MAG: hypothetical protein QW059_00220 [Nitrososphaerota archaeon]